MTQQAKPTKTEKTEAINTKEKSKAEKQPVDLTPKNPDQLKKAVALGREMVKEMATNPEITKATIARKMYELIKDESREVIAQAFVDGATLTPKGAMTYYYNAKRSTAKATAKGA